MWQSFLWLIVVAFIAAIADHMSNRNPAKAIKKPKQFTYKPGKSRTEKLNDSLQKLHGFSVTALQLYDIELFHRKEADIEKAASRLCLLASRQGVKLNLEQGEKLVASLF